MDTRQCKTCKAVKDLGEFKSGGITTNYCAPCRKKWGETRARYNAEYREKMKHFYRINKGVR